MIVKGLLFPGPDRLKVLTQNRYMRLLAVVRTANKLI